VKSRIIGPEGELFFGAASLAVGGSRPRHVSEDFFHERSVGWLRLELGSSLADRMTSSGLELQLGNVSGLIEIPSGAYQAPLIAKTNTNDNRLSAKLVRTFADRGCHVVSVTDPLLPYSRFSKPEPLVFLSSSSSVFITRLSGPRSRPTTSQKMYLYSEATQESLNLSDTEERY
jgi:hypothetical protein